MNESDACYTDGIPYCFNGKCESSAASSDGAWCTCREFWKGKRCEQLDYITFWKTVARADKFAQIFFVLTVIVVAIILSLWCYCIRVYCWKKKKSEDKLPIQASSESSSESGKSLDSNNTKVNRTNSMENRSISIRSQSSSIETSTDSKNSTNNLILPAKDMLSLYEQFSQIGVQSNYGTISGNTINGNTINGNSIKCNSINSNTINSNMINGNTINGNTIGGHSISGHTIGGNTINGHYGTIGSHYGTSKSRKSKHPKNNRNSMVSVNGKMQQSVISIPTQYN